MEREDRIARERRTEQDTYPSRIAPDAHETPNDSDDGAHITSFDRDDEIDAS
jgi:hypothetical protein